MAELGPDGGVILAPDTKVAVLGAGVEGRAVITWLRSLGLTDITLCDKDEKAEIPYGLGSQLGDDYLKELSAFEVVFRSPGVARDIAGIVDAEKQGTFITSATREFMARCRSTTIGVTGSNGKSTTTQLVASIFRTLYGDQVHVGGNDHEPLLDRLATIERDHCVILELSSFQLVDLHKSPNVAVVLNASINHLDVHGSFDAYVRAKSHIVAHQKPQDHAVLNYTYGRVREMSELTPANSFYFNHYQGDQTVLLREGKLVLRWGGKEEVVVALDDLRFKTNPDNLLASILVGKLFGIATDVIKECIAQFKGQPHCLELVRELDGVRYYDDSGSTTPDATINAITSFPVGRVSLIAGGLDKQLDFRLMAKEIVRCQGRVFLIGQTREAIAEAVHGAAQQFRATPHVEVLDSLEDAVEAARRHTPAGHAVVLSPGCASFDMFRNAEERGRRFQEVVRALS